MTNFDIIGLILIVAFIAGMIGGMGCLAICYLLRRTLAKWFVLD